MKDKVRTLLIGAEGYGKEAIRMDTARHIFFKQLHTGNRRQIFGGYDASFTGRGMVCPDNRYDTLSYVRDWEDAFRGNPNLKVDYCNATDLLSLRRHMQLVTDYDLIVILHSAAGDDMSVISQFARYLRKRRGKLVTFFGNEYDLMEEKVAFANQSRADFICSQLPLKAAKWLYEEVPTANVLEVAHGLSTLLYVPDRSVLRKIDLGFIGALYHNTVGDCERTAMIMAMSDIAPKLGLSTYIKFENFDRPTWSKFLKSCKALIGAESGTYYLQRDGEAVRKSLAYQKLHPNAHFEEVFTHAFSNAKNFISGKCISSRHFEPIGTRTCQILLEGEYNGILKPLEHYIPVKKDFSDLEEALRMFRDESLRENIAARTFDYVMDNHTYPKRVEYVLKMAVGL